MMMMMIIMIGHCRHNVVCLSVTKCIVANRYILQQKMFKQMNRKCRLGTRFYKFQPTTLALSAQIPRPENFEITFLSYLTFLIT